MDIGLSVWHTKFGQGLIVSDNKDYYEISFDGELKRISKEVWLKFLFLCKEDFKSHDIDSLKEKYKPYIIQGSTQKKIVVNNIDEVNKDTAIFYRNTNMPARSNNDLFIIDNINNYSRNVVILLNNSKKIGKTNYVELIGLDVFTGKLVKIVDTNGLKVGLHTYNSEIINIKEQEVIKASFRIVATNECINTFRITSDFQQLGRSNLLKLHDKYNSIFDVDIYKSFDSIFRFIENTTCNMFYVITKFTGTEVKQYKTKNKVSKFQIKMDKILVDINDNKIDIKMKEGLYFRGIAVLCIKRLSEKWSFLAKRLIGKYYSKKELEEIKRASKNTDFSDMLEINDMYYDEFEEDDYELDEYELDDVYYDYDRDEFYSVFDENYYEENMYISEDEFVENENIAVSSLSAEDEYFEMYSDECEEDF